MLVIVTGCASGLGLALTKYLLAHVSDSDVVGCDMNASEAITQLQAANSARLKFKKCDVTSEPQFRQVFEYALKEFPNSYPRVLINNAGLSSKVLPEHFRRDRSGTVSKLNADARTVLRVNLEALISGTYLALEYFGDKSAQQNAVVNIASMAGIFPLGPDPVYTASKFGVVGFTQACTAFAKYYGIRVHAVCPFFFDTPLVRGILAASPSSAPVSSSGTFDEKWQSSPLAKLPTVDIDMVVGAVMGAVHGSIDEKQLRCGQVIACTPIGNKLVPFPSMNKAKL